MKTIVEIEWDQPEDKTWLCPDNIASALSQVCRNTAFRCVEYGGDFTNALVCKAYNPEENVTIIVGV